MGYQFSNDWFKWHEPHWKKLISQLKPAKYLELGSYEGSSTCFFIEEASKYVPELHISCIDFWGDDTARTGDQTPEETKATFLSNIECARSEVELPIKIDVFHEKTITAIPKIYNIYGLNYYDIIYIDASHKASDVLTDTAFSFPLLRRYGIMIFDDYLSEAKPGIDGFVNLNSRNLTVIQTQFNGQLFIQKIKT